MSRPTPSGIAIAREARGYFDRNGSNKGGWLYTRIKDGQAPEGYVPRVEREKAKAEREANGRRAQAERGRKEQEGNEAVRRENAMIGGWLKERSEQELSELVREARKVVRLRAVVDSIEKGLFDEAERDGLFFAGMRQVLNARGVVLAGGSTRKAFA
jgi:hypothetical protein